ncbi:hypothetical protein AK812_SmicGene31580 [Symbiodinium microadriaticum]|uniref:Uncharacterized protein n=2 Tax=Symbiodinium TaxID=2949 RepID=A0A1Q9CWC7_SYMMI|nr:hypothetical protein AK812_SmicGene31580 [Symbiodinium microadriaticum]
MAPGKSKALATVTNYCANHHSDAVVKNCRKFYDGRHVAVIHHVNNVAVHELARKLLDHEGSEPGTPPAALPSAPAPSTQASPPAASVPMPTPAPVPPIEVVSPAVIDHSADAGMTLFCFAWSPRRKNDEGMLNEVRRQYKKCDGHLFFTDTESPVKEDEEDFVRVQVPKQRVERTHGQWLYHRNMAGLMPSWDHLLRSGIAERFDWLLNSELDHFLSPSRAKETIREYLQGLEDGSKEDKSGLSGPIMLMWGNAFVFNRKFVQALRTNWPQLGRVASSSEGDSKQGRAVGCPLFMKNRFEWPDSCSQDIIYPALAMNILPFLQQKVAFPGASGCGQPSRNRRGKAYPLGCWEMQQNPLNGESEKGELGAIEVLAKMRTFKDKWEARAYCKASPVEAVQKNCMKFWDGRNAPIIHHLHTVSEHVLARTLLDNDPDPA